MLISKIISEKRKRLGLTQADLSRLSNVSIPFIQLIESGKGNPSLESTQALLTPLNLELKILDSEPEWKALASLGVPIGDHPEKIEWKDNTIIKKFAIVGVF
jgi:transcriptional regulator with XRE-family HTH domain